MTIRNTAKDDPILKLMFAAADGGIEAMEARGQSELAADSALPTEGLATLPTEWGITIGKQREQDPLFTDVTLPAGWKLQPTEHSMWSKLVDDQGQERAAIFYKAAFYDRRAFITVPR